MSYIDSNLLSNEQVLHRGQLHWIVFATPAVLGLIGLLFLSGGEGGGAFGGILLFVAALLAARAALAYVSTELAITNQRVIAKFGFIRRSTVELNHSKVESLNVNQGVVGRMLDFGTVIVRGSGSASTPIPKIKNPLAFRRAQNEAVAGGARPYTEAVA